MDRKIGQKNKIDESSTGDEPQPDKQKKAVIVSKNDRQRPKHKTSAKPLSFNDKAYMKQQKIKEDVPDKLIIKVSNNGAIVEQAYNWTNNSGFNISVVVFDNDDNKVHFVTSLKNDYEFKCAKPYSYIVVSKPYKQTLYLGTDLKMNNASLIFSESDKVFMFQELVK